MVADGGQFFFAEAGDLNAFEKIASGAGFVEAAKNIHECRLSSAAGAHDGDKFSTRDLDTHPTQGVHPRLTQFVVLVNLLNQNYRFGALHARMCCLGL